MSGELRIGVAGLGAIGRSHIERISRNLHGGVVAGVTDAAGEFGQGVANHYRLPYHASVKDLIASGTLDALMVTAADDEHERYVMAGIQAGLPVFCEEPLASDAAACRRLIKAELAARRRFVQVGFMRRYDAGHLRLREMVSSRRFGRPLLVHCAHRSPQAGESFTTPMAVATVLIHEIDYVRWLLGEDYDAVEVRLPKSTFNARGDLRDPQMLLLTSRSGVWIDVECFMNSGTGYDVQCEVVCEEGILRLTDPATVQHLSSAARVTPICATRAERFMDAYDAEIQAWVDNCRAGQVRGPSVWDGFAACVAANAAHESRESGRAALVELPECPAPDLYLGTV